MHDSGTMIADKVTLIGLTAMGATSGTGLTMRHALFDCFGNVSDRQ